MEKWWNIFSQEQNRPIRVGDGSMGKEAQIEYTIDVLIKRIKLAWGEIGQDGEYIQPYAGKTESRLSELRRLGGSVEEDEF